MLWEQVALLEDPESVQAKIFCGLNQLERLRKQHRAFSSQADFWTFDTGSDRVLGMARCHQGEFSIGYFNFGTSDYVIKKYSRKLRNLLTGEEYERDTILPGNDFIWMAVYSE